MQNYKAGLNKVEIDYSNEMSVTKKMGHTELGDLSEATLEMQFDRSINNEAMRKEIKLALGHRSSASLIRVDQEKGSGARGEQVRASGRSDLSEVAMEKNKSTEESNLKFPTVMTPSM